MERNYDYWTCRGEVRGECGIKHTTRETAEAHCEMDDKKVKRGNGPNSYSDRHPVHVHAADERAGP